MDAAGLVTGAADLARVVRGEEGPDNKLADPDVLHVGPDILDDAHVLVPHGDRSVEAVGAAVGPQVRPAHACRDQFDDRVGGLLDGGLVTLFDAGVSRGVHDRCAHSWCSISLNLEKFNFHETRIWRP
jgi:hypothetical protein